MEVTRGKDWTDIIVVALVVVVSEVHLLDLSFCLLLDPLLVAVDRRIALRTLASVSPCSRICWGELYSTY